MAYYSTGDNNFGVAKWIVDPVPGQGTHTTIQTAINTASSGDVIAIRPGTYTEDIIAKDGILLSSMPGSGVFERVVIVGILTLNTASEMYFSDIEFESNAPFGSQVIICSGTDPGTLWLSNCGIIVTGNTGILATNSQASVRFNNCRIVVEDNSDLFSWSGDILEFKYCTVTGTVGVTTTPGAISTGTMFVEYSDFDISVVSSGTASVSTQKSVWGRTQSFNLTWITTGGSGVKNRADHCTFFSGTASCISVDTGQSYILCDCILDSSNTNAATGAGAVNYGTIDFTSSSQTINAAVQSNYNGNTFTPVLSFVGGSTGITYAVQIGKYLRVGNLVHFDIRIDLTSKGSSTGNATISGLPFNAANDGLQYNYYTTYFNLTAIGATYFTSILAGAGSTLTLFFNTAATGGFTQIADTNFANNTAINMQGFYYI